MALINCPECSKEISDKVVNCPNCGYPLKDTEEINSNPQEVEVTGFKFKLNKNKIIITIIFVIFIVIAIFLYNDRNEFYKHNNYIDSLQNIKALMLNGGAEAEKLCNLTYRVWYNTIYKKTNYETDKYTKKLGRFNLDFNDSLEALYKDKKTLEVINKIKQNHIEVDEAMKTLKNPTDEMKDCYETILSLYVNYKQYTKLAISPDGSLKSYNEEINDLTNLFMGDYDELTTKIPDKR